MNRHVKMIVFLAAIALVTVLIFNMKKEASYSGVPETEGLVKKEVLGIKVLDIFLGVLGLAFVGVAATYVVSLVKGSGAVVKEAGAEAAVTGEVAQKRIGLEKVLGRTGTRILGVILVVLLILVVLAIAILLFGAKIPFLYKLFEKLG